MMPHTPKVRTGFIAAALALMCSCGWQVRAQDLSKPSKIELGVQFSTLTLGLAPPAGIQTEFVALPSNQTGPGIGGRFTRNLTNHLALEGEGNLFPRRLPSQGLAFQAQFGVKAGHRFKRIGVFAKARPGFVSFGNVATEEGTETIGTPPLQFTVAHIVPRRRNFFSMDIGSVAEVYLSRWILLRVDV
jgi:hypothetical protein